VNLRILFVEDSADDAELMLRRLREAGIEPHWDRVQTEGALREALAGERWELALVDYNLPGFGGLQALAVLAAAAPDVPAITVSGAIDEETAVATITAGAVDYVLKDNLTRLAPAVRRAVEGAELRRQQRRAAEQARQTMYAIEHSSQAIVYVSEGGVVLYVNEAAQRLGGGLPAEAVGQEIWDWTPMVDEQRWGELWRAASQRPIVDFETTARLPGGEERLISATLDYHARDEDSFVIVYARDITEQREVEERAKESEAMYRRIVETALEGIWAMDGEYRTTFVNPQMAAMLSYETDEMIGRVDSDFMFEEDKAEQEAQRQAREKGLPGVYERRLKSKNGSEVWMHVSSVAESGPEGEFLGSFALCTDITERKRAEEALRESEERLRFLIDQTPTVNWTMDRDLRFTLSRGAGLEALGFEPDEVLGMYVGAYLGGSGPQTDLGVAMHQRALAGESFVYQQPVGDLVFDIILGPLCDAAGEIDGVIGVAYDATERKRAEDSLRESEDQFRQFAEYLPGRLTIKDAELRYVYGNDERAAEPSLPSARWIDKTPEELWTPEEALTVREIGERVLAGEVVEEVSEQSSDHGMEYWRSVHFPITRGAETVLVGGISLDVTEQVEAQEALRQSEERFRRVSEATSDFAYSCVRPPGGSYTFDWLTGAVERITGWSREDLLGWGCWKALVLEQDRPLFEERVTGLVPGDSSVCELRIRDKQDRVRWLAVYNEAEHDAEDPAVHRLHGACQDITERKHAEEELRFTKFIVEQAADIVFWTTADGVFKYANRMARETLGYGLDELRTMTITDIDPDICQGWPARMRELEQAGSITFETRHRTRDGTIIPMEITAMYREYDGDVYNVAFARDIRERKRAEEELLFTTFIVERAADLVFWMTANGVFKYANRTARETLGYSLDELRTMTIHDIDPDMPIERWPEHIEELKEAAVLTFETRHRRKDGTIIPMEITAMYLEYNGEAYDVGIARDIRERKQAQEEVRRQAEQLRRTVEGAVLAMSHVVETRDPYTAGHERRVAELATAIAGEMGMDGEELDALRHAGLIHDIGKIAVPAEILAKPGRLSEVEFNLIKQHPASGFDILEAIDFGRPVAEIVLQHHERLDGSGYPRGLAGADIQPEARILAVADVVEAMSSHRPYRAALGMKAALAEIREHAGVKYDADVVAACVRLVEEQGFQFTP
jgi:PAS domain S-box-containing protein/putative nucleotidyltransferase with HDIG domain